MVIVLREKEREAKKGERGSAKGRMREKERDGGERKVFQNF